MRPLCGLSGMKFSLEAAASSPHLPLQELGECDFPFANLCVWTERFSLLATCLAWSPFNFLKKVAAVVLAVWTGEQSCELSQSSGKCRLQRF